MFIFGAISTIAFFSPLIIGLLVYYDYNGIGLQCAKFFVEKVGFDPSETLKFSGGARTLDQYYVSLYKLIGLGIFTFVPLTGYGLVFAIQSICALFRIFLSDEENWSFIAIVVAGILAIAIAIIYWWAICQNVGVYGVTIMSSAGKPMHWGYRLMFYIFPILAILIQGTAIFIGMFLAEKLGFEDIPTLLPPVLLTWSCDWWRINLLALFCLCKNFDFYCFHCRFLNNCQRYSWSIKSFPSLLYR